jgi:hypothetical protein
MSGLASRMLPDLMMTPGGAISWLPYQPPPGFLIAYRAAGPFVDRGPSRLTPTAEMTPIGSPSAWRYYAI